MRFCYTALLASFFGLICHSASAQPETIAISGAHMLAIHADGTLWACGYNGDGRLGDGTTTSRSRPVQVGTATTWRTVSTASRNSSSSAESANGCVLALQTDGSLWAWGSRDGSVLSHVGGPLPGPGPITSPRLFSAGPWACASAGQRHAAAVRADGTLWTWGMNDGGQLGNGTVYQASFPTPQQVGTATDWTSVSAGMNFTLALKTDGSLWAWGVGFYNASNFANIPERVGTDTDWKRISAGDFALATRTNGTLWLWGDLPTALLPSRTSSVPLQVGSATDWDRIAVGPEHILATKTTGTLWSWGYGSLGQLGTSTLISSAAPTQVGSATTWRRVATGGYTSAADRADGTLWAWGSNGEDQTGNPALTRFNFTDPVQVGTSTAWTQVSGGASSSQAIRADGSLWTFGSDYYALLGDGPLVRRQTVARIDSPATYRRTYGGLSHCLALRADSSLWAWGASSRAMGTGTTIQEAPGLVAVGPWKTAMASTGYSMAIRADGTLWAWGGNSYGEFGNGTVTGSTFPIQVGIDRNWAQVANSYVTSYGLRTNGTLWRWGNYQGSGNFSSLTPVQFGSATTWAQIVSSESHVLALQTDGSLWAWGSNSSGQLGNGTTAFGAVPVRVGTATDWVSIAAGPNSTISLALKTNGTLWAWGGELGVRLNDNNLQTPLYVTVPRQVGTATWRAIGAGDGHALAVRTNGTLWAWGANTAGQCGTPSYSLQPASVQTGLRPAGPFGLASFSPGAGPVGTTVTITGTGLQATQLVTFGGRAAPGFAANAAGTTLTVAVPAGAPSGAVAVSGPDGTAWGRTAFRVLAAPVITGFAPAAAAPGATITVSGTNLTGTTAVQVGGVAIAGFVVNATGNALTFVVPAGSGGGPIRVTTPLGSATSAAALAIVLASATATTFSAVQVLPVPVRAGQALELSALPAEAFESALFDALGKIIYFQQWPAAHAEREMLTKTLLTPGLYNLLIRTNTQVIFRRVLVVD